MRLLGKFQVCLLFFYEKILNGQKAQKRKTNSFHTLRSFVRAETCSLFISCSLIFVLLVGFGLIYVFVRLKCFGKKRKRLEIVLITSYTIILKCTPSNPPFRNLFLSIYFYLPESLIICENLFFL